MFLRELTGRRDWSDENLAFGIESFELFVYARERCIECSRSWQEAPQVVKGVIHQSSDHSEFWKILAIKATDKGTRELSVQFLGDNFWVQG